MYIDDHGKPLQIITPANRGYRLEQASDPPVEYDSSAPFSRRLVLDRRYKELPPLPPDTVAFRAPGKDGVSAHAIVDGELKWFEYATTGIEPPEARFLLTYFDQVDIPSTPEIDYSWDDDTRYLYDIGFVVRSVFPIMETCDDYIWPVDEFLPDYFYAPASAMSIHSSENPGVWSFCPRLPTDGLTTLPMPLASTLEVGLYSCLPVPHAGVSFDDILHFRERHIEELADLRLGVHRVYEGVLQSANLDVTILAAKADIQKAVASLQRGMARKDILGGVVSLNTSFSVYDIMKFVGTSATIAASGLPLELGVSAGAAAALLRINIRAPKPAVQGAPVDLAYVAKVYKELGSC